MINIITSSWKEYALLDSGRGKRLERFGPYILVRPDPQAIWEPHQAKELWESAHCIYEKDDVEQGRWLIKKAMPDQWKLPWKSLQFVVKRTPFKHTGIFPEQAQQWEWIEKKISSCTFMPSVLNLFAYTGASSLVAANAGAKVTHVDSSKPAVTWARENQIASGLESKPIRWIVDDCITFAQREVKRGITYDAIIMDPPIFGHGYKGQIWKFNEQFPKLLSLCNTLLTKQPLFFLVNTYAISSSSLMLKNVIADNISCIQTGIEVGELALQEEKTQRLLSTGIFAYWQSSS